MNFGILCFVLLFCLPMGMIIASLPPATLQQVAIEAGGAVLLFVAVLLLPRLLRGLSRHHVRTPSPGALASLDWPHSLTRNELETFCAAWLRGRGWTVTLATDPEKQEEAVYLLAERGSLTAAVLCDRRGEEINPAGIRAFAHGAAELGATQFALVTLSRGKLPPPSEAAARRAGVKLLRVADLPQLDALAPAQPAPVAA